MIIIIIWAQRDFSSIIWSHSSGPGLGPNYIIAKQTQAPQRSCSFFFSFFSQKKTYLHKKMLLMFLYIFFSEEQTSSVPDIIDTLFLFGRHPCTKCMLTGNV